MTLSETLIHEKIVCFLSRRELETPVVAFCHQTMKLLISSVFRPIFDEKQANLSLIRRCSWRGFRTQSYAVHERPSEHGNDACH